MADQQIEAFSKSKLKRLNHKARVGKQLCREKKSLECAEKHVQNWKKKAVNNNCKSLIIVDL